MQLDLLRLINNISVALKVLWPSSKVVMLRIANPPFVGSIPASASILTLIISLFIFFGSLSNLSAQELSLKSLFMDAISRGDIVIVKQMTVSGYPVNDRDEFGSTALMRAAHRGHKEVVEYLLKKSADPDIQDLGGATALHLAAREGHNEVVRLLIRYSVYGELADLEGYTPSMRAILHEKPKVFETLLGNTADLNKANDKGETIITLSESSQNIKIKELIKNKLELNTTLNAPLPQVSEPEKTINIATVNSSIKQNKSFFTRVFGSVFTNKFTSKPIVEIKKGKQEVTANIDTSFDNYFRQKSSNQIKTKTESKKPKKLKVTEAVKVIPIPKTN